MQKGQSPSKLREGGGPTIQESFIQQRQLGWPLPRLQWMVGPRGCALNLPPRAYRLIRSQTWKLRLGERSVSPARQALVPTCLGVGGVCQGAFKGR